MSQLRQRAAGAQQQQGEVARRDEHKPTLGAMIHRMGPELQRALPRHMDGERMARIALTTLRQTPELEACSPESFIGALLTCAQLGLEPGPLGEAYLIPYKNEVSFQPGYKGLAKLAWNSGQLVTQDAHVVYDDDVFDYAFGLHPKLEHVPAKYPREGRAVTHVYAVATFKNGGHAFDVMTVADVERIRRLGQAPNSPAWRNHWDEMAKKTVYKRLSKWLPRSPELDRALANDGAVRTDYSAQAIDAPQVDFITGELADNAPGPDADPRAREAYAERNLAGAAATEYLNGRQEQQPSTRSTSPSSATPNATTSAPATQPPAAETATAAATQDTPPAADAPGAQPSDSSQASRPDPSEITPAQTKALYGLLRKLNRPTTGQQLELLSDLQGLPVESIEGLAKHEASGLIDRLKAIADAPQPQAALAKALAEAARTKTEREEAARAREAGEQ